MRPQYKEVKNHIHNTLGITKEDILQIIREQVQEEIRKLIVSNELEERIENSIRSHIHTVLGRGLKGEAVLRDMIQREIVNQVSRTVSQKLDVKLAVSIKE